eukprot:scaffold162411_cov33-Tisochrysis_lutea.AAC.2
MLLLTSPSAAEIGRLLEARGLRRREAVAGATSDILLTTPRGGALAFVLLRADEDGAAAVGRATSAVRAARRCTILLIGERVPPGTVAALQDKWYVLSRLLDARVCTRLRPARGPARCAPHSHEYSCTTSPRTCCSPFGVSILRCETPSDAAEHIASCAHSVHLAAETGGSAHDDPSAVMEAVATVLSSMWGVDQHDVDFLLANISLPRLARVENDADFQELLDATAGLVEPRLVEGALRWLREDAVATS